MDRNIKKKILANAKVYSLIAKMYNAKNFFTNGQTVSGKGNKLQIDGSVLRYNFNLKIKGSNNKVIISPYVRLKNTSIEIIGNNNVIHIGNKVAVYEGAKFLIEGDSCSIHLSDKVTVGSANFFAGESNTNIHIGEDCMLSRNIRINTSDFHSIIDIETSERINLPADVYVGNHVWVGNGATVHKGSHISDNTVIGANAFVNKKFMEPNVLIAGQPGKIVRSNINWDREKL